MHRNFQIAWHLLSFLDHLPQSIVMTNLKTSVVLPSWQAYLEYSPFLLFCSKVKVLDVSDKIWNSLRAYTYWLLAAQKQSNHKQVAICHNLALWKILWKKEFLFLDNRIASLYFFLRKIATNTESVIKDHHFPYLETLQFDWLPSIFLSFSLLSLPLSPLFHKIKTYNLSEKEKGEALSIIFLLPCNKLLLV